MVPISKHHYPHLPKGNNDKMHVKWGHNRIYHPHFDSWNAHNFWPWIFIWHNEPLHYSSNWNLANDPKIMPFGFNYSQNGLTWTFGIPMYSQFLKRSSHGSLCENVFHFIKFKLSQFCSKSGSLWFVSIQGQTFLYQP